MSIPTPRFWNGPTRVPHRCRSVMIRLSDTEYGTVVRQAQDVGITRLAEYVRTTVLHGHQPPTDATGQSAGDLRALTTLVDIRRQTSQILDYLRSAGPAAINVSDLRDIKAIYDQLNDKLQLLIDDRSTTQATLTDVQAGMHQLLRAHASRAHDPAEDNETP